MEEEDVEAVYVLSQKCFTIPWSLDSLRREVHNTVAVYQVAEMHGEIVGYGGLWCIVDEGEITNIAVESAYRGVGIGGEILKKLVQVALQKKLAMIHLEVRRSNLAAQKLYRHAGFQQIAVRKNYYQKPLEDALIMQYQF